MKKIINWPSYCLVLLAVLTFSQLFFVNKVLAAEVVNQCFCITETDSTCFAITGERGCGKVNLHGIYLACWPLTLSQPIGDINKGNQQLLAECQFRQELWNDSHKPRTGGQSQPDQNVENNTDPLIDLKTRTQSKLNPLKWLGATGTLGVNTFIGKMLTFIMGIIGSLLLLFYVYAGILWMTAAGNAEQMTKAKHIMLWATLSIIMQMAAYFLVRALFTLFVP